MIKNIYINNFKTLNMDAYIALEACSFLCGANSSGKSSLIQTLLMLAQTFSSRFQDDSIVLNGSLIQLGSFGDIKKHKSTSENITIGFTFDIDHRFFLRDPSIKSISCEFSLGRRDKAVTKIDEEYHPLITSAKYYVERELSSNPNEHKAKVTDHIYFKFPDDYSNVPGFNYEIVAFNTVENEELKKVYPNYKILNIARNGELVPTLINIEYDKTKKQSFGVVYSLIKTVNNNWRRNGYYSSDDLDYNDAYIPKEFSMRVVELIREERRQLLDEIDLPSDIIDILKNNREISNQYIQYNYDKSNLSTNTQKLLDEIKSNFIEVNYALQSTDIPGLFCESKIKFDDWKKWFHNLDDKKYKNLSALLEKHKEHLQAVWYNNVEVQITKEVYNSKLLQDIQSAMLHSFSRSLKYLGPLRNEPQAVYSSSPYDTNTVGLKGEFTASLLHRYRNKIVTYPSPVIINDKLEYESKKDNLNEACKDWLSFLGVVEEVKTSDKGKLGYELSVRTSPGDKWQDLTHVGVGVSQVLPIVIMFLNSEPTDVLIFEQPELHLHPKVQSKLCDLFLIMTDAGRQCIIETHSEYMINRLRLRVVQEKTNKWIDKSVLYFINKEYSNSIFKRIEVNKFGAIPEWPDDFFDQTDKEVEKILVEASRKINKSKSVRFDDDSGY